MRQAVVYTDKDEEGAGDAACPFLEWHELVVGLADALCAQRDEDRDTLFFDSLIRGSVNPSVSFLEMSSML